MQNMRNFPVNILQRIIEWPLKKASIATVDFKKPWWDIYWQQRKTFAAVLAYLTIDEAFSTIVPLMLGLILEQKSISLLIMVQIGYIVLEVGGWFAYHPGLTRLYNTVQHSFQYNAYERLLTIDPIYHIKRPSGTVIGKIKRTTTAYFDLTWVMLDDVIPFIVEVLTVLVSVFFVSWLLGVAVFASVIIIGGLFCLTIIKITRKMEQEVNFQDDQTSQLTAESLTQVQFIRATFATRDIQQKLYEQHIKQVKAQTKLWMAYPVIQGIFGVLYMILTGFIVAYLIYLINQGEISTVLATTLLLTYFRGTRKIFMLDTMVITILQAYRRITDFYYFIHTFGKQSFPVLEGEGAKKILVDAQRPTTIKLEQVTFSYPQQEPLLTDISLDLRVETEQTNKLYGIIGPSGIGKTTLISIVGGQLKPQTGGVYVNDVNVYEIDDSLRRQLLALQGQVATSMRGTLRYNLLFGVPSECPVSDTHLVELLVNVGLWKLFAEKQGLDTIIGEAGLSLSGGQRQRLNFANLYLRATCYKPALILIDEPTSSLDEVSEQALTVMINELAKTSVTFVIAHRLKTLEEAVALLDFSIVKPHSSLEFLAPAQLKEQSAYFQQLLEGTALLE